MLTIRGNKLIVTGDDHYEDIYRGRHKNYVQNVLWCMNKLEEVLEREQPAFHARTGDFIGVRNNVSKIEDRTLFVRVAKHMQSSGIPCVVNTGNHDLFGSDHNNDYLTLARLGYFHTPDQIRDDKGNIVQMITDYEDENGEPIVFYIHFVPYGQEHKKLYPVKDAVNIAVTHNDFRIGSHVFTQNPDAIDLLTHEPFFGMDLVLNGHIHEPSVRQTFKTVSGMDCTFLNLGCMARPKVSENYNQVLYAVVEVRKNALGKPEAYFREELIDLLPAEEIFVDYGSTSSQLATKETESESESELSSVIDSLRDFNWSGISVLDRVEAIPMEPEVKELVLKYLS